jgi:hypothetical protein
MAITVTCHCGKKLVARDEHAGMRAKCPTCGSVLLVPKPAAAKPAPAASDAAVAAPAGAGARWASGEAGRKAEPAIKSGATPAAAAPPAPPRPMYDGKPAADWLELLRSADSDERRKATEVLGKVGPEAKSEVPVFVARLVADHVLVRHWAITCLKQLGPAAADAVEPLFARLTDAEALLREKAARALASIVPGSDRFLPPLLKVLNDKKPETRQAAIACFRRDLRTAGISRRRFWMCSCGSVFEKDDLERQIRAAADSPSPPAWQGARKCKKCGKQYATADVYAGKYDVPEKYRAKLAARYGERIDLADDLLADAPTEDLGYRVSTGPAIVDAVEVSATSTTFSIQLPDAADDHGGGYAVSAAPVHKPEAKKAPEEEPEDTSLVPGTKVPTTGKYRCTACRKVRLSDSRSKSATAEGGKPGEPRPSFVRQFKAGKQFTECPNCGDLTEWEPVPE